ncbi:HNH endonuclease [Shewanella sp. NIFS-20-20]|uniref:HNH endonuclease n=1 Tax=Shewanella sp. NIFS-20-20 TaxID=2853806 RepID=UPI001C446BA2|nr:HNH endonuclease signature motif containing protein [Shewanella sp. NIFS-20-20]MBV7316139.1 HNH endonuclease [Shewanella sp. NIFS-20-20]
MAYKIEVTYRVADTIRTRRYQSEISAKRNIFKWLRLQQPNQPARASYFSPTDGYQQFDDSEQLNQFAPSTLENFYLSNAWRSLRYQVLSTREPRCALCRQTPEQHGISLHVDHILPRSKYPELALDINNLQILCQDCNLGKSNQ